METSTTTGVVLKVELKGITYPIDIEGIETAEQFIAYCARVSNPDNQVNNETADKLIRYLIRNQHWSPFEMVNMTIEIETTRDIGRQILRHRSFSFQEFSQRYAVSTNFITRDARMQDPKNRQNSLDTASDNLKGVWEAKQRNVLAEAQEAYEWALNNGIAKEQARAVLPEGLTVTNMYMAGTLRSWIHYVDLRGDMSTQLEHRLVAEASRKILKEHFPNIALALEWPQN